ncbi:MAG: DoxX family membrane protein [Alphaproteobacteria bacterium]|nr:MAG: DoxX family membrane protein [Alphaproteobacteria bacterium]
MSKILLKPIHRFNALVNSIPNAAILLVARLAAATPFWMSGQNKVVGWDIWNVTQSTVFLFEYEYDLPLISPALAASAASIGEHVLPILLVLGLLTRIGAAGLIIMTLVIQTFVYPEAWTVHLLWFAPLLLLMVRGGGSLSLDHLFGLDKPKTD